MNIRIFAILFVTAFSFSSIFGQRPGDQQGRPGGPPRDGQQRPGMEKGRPDGPPPGEWIRAFDANQNGILEAEEFQGAMDRTFVELDKNKNGSIEPSETLRPPRHDGEVKPEEKREGAGEGRNQGRPPILPPFFFLDRVQEGQTVTRSEYDRIVRGVFSEMDRNGDGALNIEEARLIPPRPGGAPPRPEGPNMPPNAKFIGAELRFGDKLVKGQPFSAEIVIEDTKRLYDGSTVTKQNRGAIYRDSEGRTRREQPLEMVGGVSIVGENNKPQTLVFINDFSSRSQIFLDLDNKVARKNPLGDGPGPLEPRKPLDAKEESLGTKTIEGISVEGTREIFEIPAGQIGNAKAIQVVTEKWFSKDLQVLVMSRHLDPIAGEHVFKLVNIKRSEPNADLFSIPQGFRIENMQPRRPQE